MMFSPGLQLVFLASLLGGRTGGIHSINVLLIKKMCGEKSAVKEIPRL